MARKILFEIEVENVGAARRIEALREEIRRLNKEIKGAEIGSPIFNDLVNRLTDAKQETARLKDEQKLLNREFQAAKFPKDSLAGLRIEYAKLTDQIKILSAEERRSAFGQNLVKNAAGVKKEIDAIEQSIGRFTGNVGNYKSAFASLAQIATGGLVGGGLVLTIDSLTNSFTKGLTALQDYGKGLSRLSAITGVTGAALDDLEQRATGLTTIQVGDSEIVSTAQQIFEAFTLVGSARPELLKDAAALEEVTKQAIILSKASGDELPASVAAITASLAQFQLEATDSAEVINLLAAGSRVGKVEIPGLTDSITRLGPTAKNSNVNLAETVAIFETMADKGLEGERAAVSLRNVFVRLSAADVLPKKAQEAFQRLGIDVGILADKTLPLEARLQELSKAAGDTVALFEIFGVENIDAASILASSVPKYTELLAAVQGTNDAYTQAATNADNAAQRFANLEAKGVNLLTNAFLGIEPAITGVVDLLSGLVDVLSEAPEFVSENAKELAALGFVLLAFTRTAQTAVASTTAMTASQVSWAVALRGAALAQTVSAAATQVLTAAMNALPLVAVVAGIYAIAKAFEAYEDSASASERASRAVAEAQGEIAEETAREISSLERNIEVLKSETASKGLRKKAIDDLLKTYPDYLKGIDLEKASLAQLTEIEDDLTASIYASSIARKEAEADEKLVEQRIKNEQEIIQNEEKILALEKQRGASTFFKRGIDTEIVGIKTVTASLEEQNNEIEKQRNAQKQQFDELRARLTGQLPERQFSGLINAVDGLGVSFENTANLAKGSNAVVGDSSELAGKKIQGLGDKTKGAKQEIEAQQGSIAALRKEISDLEKQIEATAPESPQFAVLVRQLDEIQAKLKAAQRAFESAQFRARGGRITAPEIEDAAQPEIEFETGLKSDSAETLKNEAEAARAAAEAQLRSIGFDVTVNPPTDEEINRAQILFDIQRQEGAKLAEEEKRRQEESAALRELALQSSLDAAQTIAGSLFEIQSNRLQRETDAAIAALDTETQAQIAAANGNEAKIAQIEKNALKKREVIEKQAAKERKQIAVKEAIVNTALAITRALTGAPPPANLILAGVAAAAGAAQLAVINSQEFWEGGTVKRLSTGRVKEKQNAPATAHGDTVLAYLAPGEMVLNEPQQNTIRSLFGKDAFALAGVPGESATRRPGVPAFASGGVVGVVPQNGFARTASQPVAVKVESEFTNEQAAAIGTTIGSIVAQMVGKSVFDASVLGADENNRLAERTARAQENRRG